MEYEVITARECGELTRKVLEAISKGWEPLGGVAIQKIRDPIDGLDTRCMLYAQAVVLKA